MKTKSGSKIAKRFALSYINKTQLHWQGGSYILCIAGWTLQHLCTEKHKQDTLYMYKNQEKLFRLGALIWRGKKNGMLILQNGSLKKKQAERQSVLPFDPVPDIENKIFWFLRNVKRFGSSNQKYKFYSWSQIKQKKSVTPKNVHVSMCRRSAGYFNFWSCARNHKHIVIFLEMCKVLGVQIYRFCL